MRELVSKEAFPRRLGGHMILTSITEDPLSLASLYYALSDAFLLMFESIEWRGVPAVLHVRLHRQEALEIQLQARAHGRS
jgi:hypothetical protein